MPTNYIDFSTNGDNFQTASLFRPRKYARVGNSVVRSPTQFSLSDLYAPKNIYSPLPQNLSKPPQVAPVLPQQPQEAIGITNTPNVENFVEQGGWQKWNTLEGNQVWMPAQRADKTALQDGDVYTTSDGAKYRWDASLGTWLKIKRVPDPDTGIVKWVIDPEDQPFIGTDALGNKVGQVVSYESLGDIPDDIDTAQGKVTSYTNQLNTYQTQWTNLQQSTLQGALDAIGKGYWTSADFQKKYGNHPVGKAVANTIGQLNSLINNLSSDEDIHSLTNKIKSILASNGWVTSWASVMAKAILGNQDKIATIKDAIDNTKSQLEQARQDLENAKNLESNLPQASGEQQLSDITNWQQQLQDTVDKFRAGDISTNPQDLVNSDNWTERWLGTVLENAQKTGLIVDPFTDANGDLSPEIQNIINTYNENIANAHTQEMKNLRLAAIMRGHSPNDVYYNEALSNWQAGASMEMANNISNLLVNEMQNSYQFISNALADALRASNKATEADMLQNEMSNQWAQALDDYKMKIESLAQEMADTNAAKQGQIITAIIGLVSSILGTVL